MVLTFLEHLNEQANSLCCLIDEQNDSVVELWDRFLYDRAVLDLIVLVNVVDVGVSQSVCRRFLQESEAA